MLVGLHNRPDACQGGGSWVRVLVAMVWSWGAGTVVVGTPLGRHGRVDEAPEVPSFQERKAA
jgi:hypothetical protein